MEDVTEDPNGPASNARGSVKPRLVRFLGGNRESRTRDRIEGDADVFFRRAG